MVAIAAKGLRATKYPYTQNIVELKFAVNSGVDLSEYTWSVLFCHLR